jgi:hypothetical protein
MFHSTRRRSWILIGWFAAGLALRIAAAAPPEKAPEKPAT